MTARSLSFAGPAVVAAIILIAAVLRAADSPPEVAFRHEPGKVVVLVDGRPIATYVYEDEKIHRPYFAHVRAPGGVQVTRNHPPVAGQDPTDHADCHSGLWMSFKDVNGSCYWRSEARVVQEAFAQAPTGGPGRGTFTVRNRYLAQRDEKQTVCQEVCRYTFLVRPAGYLLIWDSTFRSDGGFYFGDAEEMGLAVRVATPIAVKQGGTILDASGRRNERQVWGNSADWCDYSGNIDGRRAGITMMCAPRTSGRVGITRATTARWWSIRSGSRPSARARPARWSSSRANRFGCAMECCCTPAPKKSCPTCRPPTPTSSPSCNFFLQL